MNDKIHILVVDDEPDIRESFQEYLEINGYRVSGADGAAEARRLVDEHDIPWDTAWDASNDPVLPGSASNAYNPTNQDEAWQEPRQWILDQNNGIHRVLSQTSASSVEVELVRPVSLLPPLPPHYFQNAQDTDGDGAPDANVVSNIWYIPVEVDLVVGGNGIPVQLTPVYVTVREL